MWMRISSCEIYVFTPELHTFMFVTRRLKFSHVKHSRNTFAFDCFTCEVCHMWNLLLHLISTFLHLRTKQPKKKKQRRPRKIFTCETCWIHMCNWIQFHIFTHELSENRVNPERLTCVIWKKDITFMWHTWFVVDIMRTRRSEWTSVVFTPTWIQFVH